MAKGGSFDFKEIEKLQKQIEEIERGREEFCHQCANELAAQLLRMVKERTPVGRAPKLDGDKIVKVKIKDNDGKIKTRSFLSKKGEILQKYWSGYTGGTLRRSWTAGSIQKKGDAYQIEISNPAAYAQYVEYGHRQKPGRYVPALGKRLKTGWVKGTFMMTISEQKIQEMAPALLKKMLEKYLRGCLDV